jgi:hypothetical protein
MLHFPHCSKSTKATKCHISQSAPARQGCKKKKKLHFFPETRPILKHHTLINYSRESVKAKTKKTTGKERARRHHSIECLCVARVKVDPRAKSKREEYFERTAEGIKKRKKKKRSFCFFFFIRSRIHSLFIFISLRLLELIALETVLSLTLRLREYARNKWPVTHRTTFYAELRYHRGITNVRRGIKRLRMMGTVSSVAQESSNSQR